MTQRQGWHPEDIKAAIRKKGKTLTRLALEAGLSESACRMALRGPMPAAEQVISLFLAVTKHQLWPHRYDKNGSRVPSRSSEPSKSAPARHSQKSKAA